MNWYYTVALISLLDRTSIIPQQYPIEEQKSAGVERACRLNKDSRVSASIQWFKTTEQGTLQIQNEPGYRVLDDDNQVLRFISLRSLTDEGQFSCSVTSAAGNASARYNITIIEVPLRPNAEAETAEAPRTITITWTAPFNGNRPILNYRVRRRETSTGKIWFSWNAVSKLSKTIPKFMGNPSQFLIMIPSCCENSYELVSWDDMKWYSNLSDCRLWSSGMTPNIQLTLDENSLPPL